MKGLLGRILRSASKAARADTGHTTSLLSFLCLLLFIFPYSRPISAVSYMRASGCVAGVFPIQFSSVDHTRNPSITSLVYM